jgi:hypothetical protein
MAFKNKIAGYVGKKVIDPVVNKIDSVDKHDPKLWGTLGTALIVSGAASQDLTVALTMAFLGITVFGIAALEISERPASHLSEAESTRNMEAFRRMPPASNPNANHQPLTPSQP